MAQIDGDGTDKQSGARGRTSGVRRGNMQLVVEALRLDGPSSQAALARRTQLSPATVNNIVKSLRSQGVAEIEPVNGRESLVTLVSHQGVFATVEVNVTSARATVFDFARRARHEAVEQYGLDVDGEGGSPEQAMRLLREAAVTAGVETGELDGIAVAMQAPVARETGAITSWARMQLPAWTDLPIEQSFEEAFGVPVIAENDANLAALAEWSWGAGRGAAEFLFVMCSAGIGGGFVLDGKIYRGGDGLAGEIGHLVLDPNGPMCFCGSRGCLTTFASERSILHALESANGARNSLAEVVADAWRGDPACRRILYEAGRALGRAFADIAKIMAPSVIAVGGVLAEAGPLVFDGLRSSVEMNSLRAVSPAIQFRSAQLKADATALGGLAALLAKVGQGASTLPGWLHE